MTQSQSLKLLLDAIATGDISPTAAIDKIQNLAFESVDDFAKIDHHRSLRTGFPEVIWGLGKTPEQITQIMKTMGHQHPMVMATRIEAEVYDYLEAQIPEVQYYPMARICALGRPKPAQSPCTITILTAGTADLPVAEEAAVSAELFGFSVQRLWDVGVAGIQRLLSHRSLIEEADILIVVAGMEGALPSVVAGIAPCPVIAVPTSIGYGTHFSGVSPLLTMLNSCASGMGVMNIDNGFGAAILAGKILRTVDKYAQKSSME